MRIVLDVNIILSALIRDSITRKIIMKSGFDLYFPEPSLHKINKYKEYIIKKSGLGEEDFNIILTDLFKRIRLISRNKIERNWNKAKEAMEHIDEEDIVFIATALSLEDSIIWSDDADFDKQDKVRVLKTKDVMRLFME